jgi:hypothetical protein
MEYAELQARKVKPMPTQEQIEADCMKADIALIAFLLALAAIYISMTDWLSAPLVF